jgi:phage major head subunit gpT-like protein
MPGTILKEKGLKATFIAAAKAAPSFYQQLCMVVPSKARSEKHAWLGMPPAVREFIGPRQAARLAEGTYEIINKKWESTLRIEQDDIDDDQTGQLMPMIKSMGVYFNRHKDELLLGTTIPNANAVTGLDGQYFYDTDHAWPEADYSTSWDNDRTTNISSTSKPTTVEFNTALKDALQQLELAKDDRGKPANIGISKIILEGPPHMRQIFMKFMSATNLGIDAATNAEDGNLWKGMIAGIIINPYTSNSDRFRVHLVDQPLKPFIFQNRMDPLFQLILANQKNPDFGSFSEDANYFGVKARYNIGYGDHTKSLLHIFT